MGKQNGMEVLEGEWIGFKSRERFIKGSAGI